MKPTIFKQLTEAFNQSSGVGTLVPSTQAVYVKYGEQLCNAVGEYPLVYDMNAPDAVEVSNKWFAAITDSCNLSNYQRNNLKDHLNRVYMYGVKSYGIAYDSNPAIHMPTLRHEIRETSPFTKPEMAIIYDRTFVKGYRALTLKESLIANMARFLFCTGMRPAEARNLKLSDIVLDDTDQGSQRGRLIQIIGAKGREAGKVSRYVAVTPEVLECIRVATAHRHSIKKPQGNYLFLSVQGRSVKQPSMTKDFQQLMARIGFEGKELYDLRRGCATEIIHNNDYGITVAQKQLGHKNISTTMRYESLGKKRAAGLFKGFNLQ